MREFLRKAKLIDSLTTEIVIQKSDFVRKFSSIVDEGGTSLLSSSFDVFSPSKNAYKGKVDFDEFKIRKKKKLFDMNLNMAVATGTYKQVDEKLIIETEINGFSGIMIPFYIFGISIYIIAIGVLLMVDDFSRDAPVFVFPFLIIHAALMFGIPYFVMRSSTKKMKYELERELHYLTK